ncbi:hypothetical protein A3A46_04280 [Candidatus Roizmanbacteria bacterium RIFCSPLOWO2_01_FULL_37_13]|uniref:Non-canonical purine NTP pyrophosphatase n=1 Tax=Candidatus Roizmanbacteria bacterium RIFCSPHIGHO2_02_FULL_38_11 TaxID=1802039 RepID=A0A1F7H0V2_9BACT|nr:MAG: hypothetical protein A3C25_03155 [Candidatus Roizmanbacteria bacterium RIFCSPHIGHO2_02_FULL_38_11]OGK40992.1 MAG: hypothetical protein A3A46_04280 [Candidatus Roizmanbacteria bacterium RIFCSPLOWO2_01_FULL_37_13]
MKKILIATQNKAKLKELKFGLQNLEKSGVKIVSLADLRIASEPHETGKTFQENAEIKARFYGGLTKLPAIADDGGLVIPYLNNGPGVKSRRWLGREATDEELIQHTLLYLKGVQKTDRTAYLQTCVCFYYIDSRFRGNDKPVTICESEKIEGHIAETANPRRIKGFPYRALFIVDKFNKYYDELTDEEHKKINHRLKALKRLVKRIKKYLIEL